MQEDKHIDPNNKARWGFGGSEESVTVGPQTVGETGGVDSARTESDETAARNNGGGKSSQATKASKTTSKE